jgi:hypothetical protein
MASHFGPIFLTENYVLLQCDDTTWDHVSQGMYSYTVYWPGIPYQGKPLVRVPPEVAHHFTGTGGFSRVENAG